MALCLCPCYWRKAYRVLVKARNHGAPPRYAYREMGGVKHFVESYAVAVPVLSLVTVHTAVQ